MQRILLAVLVVSSCKSRHEPEMREGSAAPPAPVTATKAKHDAVPRADFNRNGVRLNLPVFWVADTNKDGSIDPDETASLLFYPTTGHWVDHGAFTKDFEDAYAAITKVKTPTDPRIALVAQDLDQGRATLVRTPVDDKKLLDHMRKVAEMIDGLYETQMGATALAGQLPADPESHSLFRRNRGPKCVAPATENNPQCSAIPGAPKPAVDVYPADIQKADTFCKDLEKLPNAKELLTPFTVVRDGKAVPYSVAYAQPMTAVSKELETAASDAGAGPLGDYLRAAAASFRSNDWNPADEAWAKMTVDNSQYYVRVGPDEVYWEPCSHKAGFHLTFAKINQGSREWQKKLVPVQQEMEKTIAARAGAPYTERKVTFHLPDFIDVIFNAGDDRTPLGATIGQSLPNWGPVANEGRGRTVAMVNFYSDPDSREARRQQAASMLDDASMKLYSGEAEPGLLVTILHEATHNLGPAHEYQVGGKKDGEIFSGPVASMLEELKAQTGGLFLIEFLRGKGLITDDLAHQAYADAIVWAFGHISQGMYSGDKKRKTYGNVAAIQIGFLLEHGALTANPDGKLTIHLDKMVPVVDDMMKTVAGIKARGDKAGAEALIARYVDDKKIVPHDTISERFLRFPKASFVYSLD
jgi:hypothetical protein